jgi:1-acyl-sn-glycerol-3-phosphate acyltransferase
MLGLFEQRPIQNVRVDDETLRAGIRLLEPLRRYHRYRVEGAEFLPRQGAWMFVVNHSLATYDGFLAGLAVYEATGRMPRGLGDDRIFQIPRLRRLAREVGLVPASPEAGLELLKAGEILGLAPGGMWESLRPLTERYRVRWEGRLGFARLALRAQVPLVLAACPAADEIYDVWPSSLTDRMYHAFHWPVPLGRGVGPTLIPRPVALTHYFAAPIVPPTLDPSREEEQVVELHQQAVDRMGRLLSERRGGP